MADVSDIEAYLNTFDAEPGYLNWASFGPLSRAVRTESLADAELLGSGRASGISVVIERARDAREEVAALLGVASEQVVLQPSTTYGIMHAVYGLAGGVLVSPREFPSLTVSTARAQAARGVLRVRELVTEHPGFVTPDAVRASLTDDIEVVALSLVDYRTGYLADLTAIRDVIGDRLLIVDAMQGFGVVDADWSAADVVAANGYKWLRAGRGTGFAWYSERALERIDPVLSGFAGMAGELGDLDVPGAAAGAAAFAVSQPDHLAAARLATAVREVIDSGLESIVDHLALRTEAVIRLADRYDVPVITPRERERRAGIVTLHPADSEVGPMAAAIANHGLTVTVRGGMIRVSPHVGTGADTLQLLGDALAEGAAVRAW